MLHSLEPSSPVKAYLALHYKGYRFLRIKDYILKCVVRGGIFPLLVDEVTYKKSRQ